MVGVEEAVDGELDVGSEDSKGDRDGVGVEEDVGVCSVGSMVAFNVTGFFTVTTPASLSDSDGNTDGEIVGSMDGSRLIVGVMDGVMQRPSSPGQHPHVYSSSDGSIPSGSIHNVSRFIF